MFLQKPKAASQNIKAIKGICHQPSTAAFNNPNKIESEKLNRMKVPYNCIENATDDPSFYVMIPHFEDIISHIKTQKGSRQMQDFLKKASINQVSLIIEKIKGEFGDLMKDSYGNYFC